MMKLLYIFGVIYFVGSLWRSTEGQDFEDPLKSFQPITLDYVNRGSFNISGCLNDLINCWELVRGDVICWHGRYFETVCGLSREYCQDVIGDIDTTLTYYEFTLFEAVCQNRWHENYT
ncbi:uncharacterized protein LOC119188369 [Manduca sexta]|uniref:uncharacterized protein LOC115439746 n=1 Tax=Manduca sexta TaxID=7130 RepID=UPI001184069D|nr:uncharacterized protein LOC115439746 [Manduca sexta]XP_037296048.1 uncharacterized protein LOC119188369 [Manduca sexta]